MDLLELCERVYDTLPEINDKKLLRSECYDWGLHKTMDVLIDLNKPAGFHDTWCCNCKRTDVFVFKCQAANCYASFCEKCSIKSKGVMHHDTYVCGMCMDVRKPIGDSFDASGKSKSTHKESANYEFYYWVNFLHDYACTSRCKNILVLDGESCQTSRRFLGGIPFKLYVPNPDPNVCDKLTALGVAAFPIRVGGFLTNTRNDENYRFSAAWMDYCCTYDGSTATNVYPRQDLWKLWFSGFDKHGDVLLFLTVCTRGKVRTSIEEIQTEQAHTAGNHGWAVRHLPIKRYGQMALLGFIARHKTFNSSSV